MVRKQKQNSIDFGLFQKLLQIHFISGLLGDDEESYGKQRMFGSMGWGLAMLIVGLALDQSKWFSDHPCGNVQAGMYLTTINYLICHLILDNLQEKLWPLSKFLRLKFFLFR